MDFMSDSLADGRLLRTFNVIDDYNREGLSIDVDLSLPSERVIRSLENIIEWRGKPAAIRCDNGPEYIVQAIIDWVQQHRITLLCQCRFEMSALWRFEMSPRLVQSYRVSG